MVDSAPTSEPSLVTSARAGSEDAFDALIGTLIEPAYKLAVVLLGNSEEAEDAVQEACFKAWRKLHQLHVDSPLRPWFLTIFANQCRSLRRARWWSVKRVPSVQGTNDFPGEWVDWELDLDRAIDRLPATDRAALFLFFYLDAPLAEVSRILKISPQAAKSRVHRAVVKLRLSMEVAES